MNKKALVLILMLMFLMSFGNVVFADEIQLIPKIELESVNEVMSEKYQIINYSFDTEDFGIFDFIPAAFKGFAEFVFMLNVLYAKVVNYLVVECFRMNIFTFLGDLFDDIMHSLRDAVYAPLLSFVIPIAGIGVIFNAMMFRFNKALSSVLKVFLVLVLAATFFVTPAYVMEMANDVTLDFSNVILSSTASVVSGRPVANDDAMANFSNAYWDLAVIKPWQIIEFGYIVDSTTVDDILSERWGSSKRDAVLDSGGYRSNQMFSLIGQSLRMVASVFILIVNICMGAILAALAAVSVMLQVGSVTAAMVSVLAFALAILPNMSINTATKSIFTVFEFQFWRLGAIMFLCVYFVLSNAVYLYAGSIGWFGAMVFQVLVLATLYFFRFKIFSFARAVTKGEAAMNRSIESKPNIKRAAAEAYIGFRMYRDVKGVVQRTRDKRLSRKFEPTAKDYLYDRYNQDVATADRVAAEKTAASTTGEVFEPEYSDFVKNADARVDQGFKPFSVPQIRRTTEMMKDLKKQGENPERLVMTSVEGKTDAELRYSQRNREKKIEATKERLQIKEDANEEAIKRSIHTDKQSKFFNRREAGFRKMNDESEIRYEDGDSESGYARVTNQSAVETVSDNDALSDEIIEAQQTADGTVPVEVSQEARNVTNINRQQNETVTQQHESVGGHGNDETIQRHESGSTVNHDHHDHIQHKHTNTETHEHVSAGTTRAPSNVEHSVKGGSSETTQRHEGESVVNHEHHERIKHNHTINEDHIHSEKRVVNGNDKAPQIAKDNDQVVSRQSETTVSHEHKHTVKHNHNITEEHITGETTKNANGSIRQREVIEAAALSEALKEEGKGENVISFDRASIQKRVKNAGR